MPDRSGLSLVISALILGVAMVGSSALFTRSFDRAADGFSEVIAKLDRPAPAAAAAAAPAAPRRGPDPAKRYTIDTKGAPAKGAAEAKLTIVEFSDFQCPFCARVGPTLEQIQKEYGDRVEIVFKHLPLRFHKQAPAAHAAAEAAHQQGKFWEMHDKIFENQKVLTPAQFDTYAQELGLDMKKYKADVASAAVKKRVSDDSAQAAKLGVTGTPSFFVNGRYMSGAQPFESFQRLIDEELKEG